jgi:hypothetical protein
MARIYAAAMRTSISTVGIEAVLGRIYVARRCVRAARANANEGAAIID